METDNGPTLFPQLLFLMLSDMLSASSLAATLTLGDR